MKVKSSSGSFSRMKPQREDVKQRIGSSDSCSRKRITDKFILLPASYILKSHDRTDGSIALADKVKVPIKTISSAILKTVKNEKQLDDSSSKISRCSSSKKILRASYCDDKSPKQPMTFIECTTTPKGPLTRITQCSTKAKEGGTNYYIYLGSKLKKDSSCKIIQSLIDSAKRIIPDKKRRVSSERIRSKRRISCQKLKPEVTHRSPPDRKPARSGKADLKIDILFSPEMKDLLSQITHKDGLDPSKVSSSLEKPSRRSKKQIFPSGQLIRSAAKDICSDLLYTKPSGAKFSPVKMYTTQKRVDDPQLQRLTSEQMLRTEIKRIESAKSDKASACQRSAVVSRRACLISEKASEDKRLPSSQELLVRYKDYIPAYQLERYETCRTKRNGLQDECIPPLLRTILKKEEQRTLDKCVERGRNVDQLDQRGMTVVIRVDQ